MNIELKDKETGYEAVAKYIEKYWDKHGWYDSIVELEISYDDKDWDRIKEIVYPTNNCREMEWFNDWWEGQKYIHIIGMATVDEIDVLPFKE